MLRAVPYRIEYSPETVDHLAELTARQCATVLDVVPRQLAHEPTVPTRNRARMRPNPMAHCRLRIGDLRVYYDVIESPERIVVVKAVGIKVRDRVFVGREELKL
jgi:mRNA-degrading endonuclease RelE of RelBE toxin-antitoxin system